MPAPWCHISGDVALKCIAHFQSSVSCHFTGYGWNCHTHTRRSISEQSFSIYSIVLDLFPLNAIRVYRFTSVLPLNGSPTLKPFIWIKICLSMTVKKDLSSFIWERLVLRLILTAIWEIMHCCKGFTDLVKWFCLTCWMRTQIGLMFVKPGKLWRN